MSHQYLEINPISKLEKRDVQSRLERIKVYIVKIHIVDGINKMNVHRIKCSRSYMVNVLCRMSSPIM